jgi:hypothetical protein
MSRTIVEWEWWRLLIGSNPCKVWNMAEPDVAGGISGNLPRYRVCYWKPAYVVSVVTWKYFKTENKANRFYRSLLKRGYIQKGFHHEV